METNNDLISEKTRFASRSAMSEQKSGRHNEVNHD